MLKIIKRIFSKKSKLQIIKLKSEIKVDEIFYINYLNAVIQALKKETYKYPHHVINVYVECLEGEISKDKKFYDWDRIEAHIKDINNLIK